MPIIDNGPTGIIKGVRTLLFDASIDGLLPGLFSGKIRPQSTTQADSVLIELIGRTTGNVTEDIEVSKIIKSTDLHFYLTPLQAFLAYKLYVTLLDDSTSEAIMLDYEINRGPL